MFRKLLVLIVLLVILLTITYHFVVGGSSPASGDMGKGREVSIEMPNGTEIETYEVYLEKEDGILYYKGDYNIIDLTGASVVYKDPSGEWEWTI